MTDSNRPRHSLDDDLYEDDAFAFEDDSDDAAAAGAGAGAAGAGAGAGTGAAGAGSGSGLPLRGLAMILMAVAVVLIAWGGFSMFGGGSNDGGSNNASQNASQEQQAGQNQQGQEGQPGSAAPSGENGAAGAEGDRANAEGANGQNAGEGSQQGQPGVGQNDGAAAGAGEVNKAEQLVTVLNNSPIQGLASQTADKLRGEQWQKTSYGNLPDTDGAFANSVVLYPGNDANAKAAAEEIAQNLGIRAEARTPEIDGQLRGAEMFQGEAPAPIVVITTNDMPR